MSIQSNALNFLSYTQGRVDPRTGQYSFSIELPSLNANYLQGPELPVTLDFNPLNDSNAGFGIGWALNLSRYNTTSGVLSLHSGESFAVSDNGPGQPAPIPERKLESFHFDNVSDAQGKRYRVAHKSGLIEILEPLKTDSTLCLPSRVMTPSGHGITLEYDLHKGRLASIRDDSAQLLLNVTFNGNHEAVLDIHPGTEAHMQFKLLFDGELLHTVVMPTEDQARWTFHYQSFGTWRYLERLVNPLNGEERVTYKEHGHQLPGVEKYLPHVVQHIAQPNPLDPSTFIRTEYAYSRTNFMGYNASGVVWDEHYNQDHLYKFTGTEYRYDSTASHYLGDRVLRTVKCSFNRFHLMTEQVTDEAGCSETVKTQYYEKPGSFQSQDEYFQLPSKVTKTWVDASKPHARRDETMTTVYDRAGNLIEETLASGVRMLRTYYPVTESDGCPKDPEGFRRNLQSITTYPAETPGSQTPGPILRTRYTYKSLPVLASTAHLQQAQTWLVAESEELVEVVLDHNDRETEQLLRRVDMGHLNMPDNLFLHGRSDSSTTQMGTSTSRTRWHYEKAEDQDGKLTCLRTKTTLTPPGGTLEKTTSELYSALRNQVLEDEDANGVITRYRYDALNRLVLQTVAPNEPKYTASRAYQYGTVTENKRSLWYAQVTDVNGVVNRTYHDGLNRPVRAERTLKDLAGGSAERITRTLSEMAYDSTGRVISETSFDYLPAGPGSHTSEERVLSMTSHYAYDAWGETCEVIRPDGVREMSEFSPFGEDGTRVTQWTESPDKPGVKQQVSVVEHNRFNKPVYTYLLHQPGDERSQSLSQVETDRTDFTYDGLGRCIKEVFRFPQAQLLAPRVTEYRYDAWGRMFETQRPDGTVVTRTFAGHSSNELTTLLEIRDKSGAPAQPACKRTFDGLERVTSMSVGPRLENYAYQSQTQLLETRTISNTDLARNDKGKQVLRYQYEPALTTQPTHMSASVEGAQQTLAADAATFTYLPTSADIIGADNATGARVYTYTDQGYLAGEHWNVEGQEQYNILNLNSLDGRLIYRKHSDGVACQYGHDALGRVETITQGDLHCTLEYNSEGRLQASTTRDSRDATRYVRSTRSYDDLGRERRRTLDANGEQWVLVLQWRDSTTLQSRTLYREGNESEDAFIRKEVFGYDELDRLVTHDFEGDWSTEAPDSERRKALPRNTKGRSITAQIFSFDALDNLSRCRTLFDDDQLDDARFSYAEDGSFQLTKVTHTLLDDYPGETSFTYDTWGNMLNDEQGRRLEYDSQGRLQRVLEADGSERVSYRYDAHNQLLASVHGGQRAVHRRYQGNSLDSTQENDLLTQYLYGDGDALGMQQAGKPDEHQLLLTDNAGSVVAEVDREGARYASYSAYGERPADNGLHTPLAFNGEVREEGLGWYLLGNGYRAYNPSLMRFHSPDSLAPELSGLNPYMYALGNPVKWRDPTGHYAQSGRGGLDFTPAYIPSSSSMSWTSWIGVAVSAIFLVVQVVTMPWSAPAALAMASTYAKAMIGIVGQGIAFGMQVASVLTAESNPVLSTVLGYSAFGVSLGSGLIGGTAASRLIGAVKAAKESAGATSVSGAVAKLDSARKILNAIDDRLGSSPSFSPKPSPVQSSVATQTSGLSPTSSPKTLPLSRQVPRVGQKSVRFSGIDVTAEDVAKVRSGLRKTNTTLDMGAGAPQNSTPTPTAPRPSPTPSKYNGQGKLVKDPHNIRH